jgi:Protein of unknown function (DUF3024)
MGTSVGRSCPPAPAPDLKGSRQMADSVGEAMSAVEAYCESRVPEDLRDQMRIECARRGKSITIVERRPPWNPDFGAEWSSVKVAQLRYEESAGAWTLHCSDSNGRWHRFDLAAQTKAVEPLLGMIEADPTGIFWG